MYKITEKQFKEMPSELQALYEKLPNPSSDEVVSLFPNTKSTVRVDNQKKVGEKLGLFEGGWKEKGNNRGHNDSRSAARFFYVPKASKEERNEGLDGFETKNNMRINAPRDSEEDKFNTKHKNNHPTVKPIALMQYLIKLITPPDGIVMDPFIGSGTTAIAAYKEHKRFIGFEKEQEYFNIAEARIKHYTTQTKLDITEE
jgi:site-specific DNA-methyltransferase (adenine-specific)